MAIDKLPAEITNHSKKPNLNKIIGKISNECIKCDKCFDECAFIRKYALDEANEVLFSPVFLSLKPAVLAEWIIREFPPARLNLQLHRFIWPEKDRGR